jgi:hypothetical protein
VRPPHVSPPALSGAALARPSRFAIAALVAGLLAVAGCGGATVTAPEVPTPYSDAPIPSSPDAPPAVGASGSATATPTPTPTATATTGATGSTGITPTSASAPTSTSTGTSTGTGGTSTTSPASSGGGAAAPASGTDSQSNDTPPPAGSNAQKFEDFCAQNPGAC